MLQKAYSHRCQAIRLVVRSSKAPELWIFHHHRSADNVWSKWSSFNFCCPNRETSQRFNTAGHKAEPFHSNGSSVAMIRDDIMMSLLPGLRSRNGFDLRSGSRRCCRRCAPVCNGSPYAKCKLMVREMTELGGISDGISHNHAIPTSSNITIRFSTLFNTINRINTIGLTCDRSFRVPTVRFAVSNQ